MARAVETGSSPRGRGKPLNHGLQRLVDGLIPAWAGKTRRRAGRSECSAAHPRVGGENADSMAEKLGLSGSSPRGRGKPARPHHDNWRVRLIPAWAGKTCGMRSVSRRMAAHPRVGGENAFPGWKRGRLRRLIPAWAGKTLGGYQVLNQQWAHPRVGGENRRVPLRGPRVRGSSPRRRGKLLRLLRWLRARGLIPA